MEKVWHYNHELRKKLRDLEDRFLGNVRINGLDEYENEKWEETKELFIETFPNHQGLENVKIETAHRIRDP